jgi:hypothetical protein
MFSMNIDESAQKKYTKWQKALVTHENMNLERQKSVLEKSNYREASHNIKPI